MHVVQQDLKTTGTIVQSFSEKFIIGQVQVLGYLAEFMITETSFLRQQYMYVGGLPSNLIKFTNLPYFER